MQPTLGVKARTGQGGSTGRRSVVTAIAVALALVGSAARAEPVAFTINSTLSALDLTASGSIFSTALAVSEQALGSKAVRYFSPSSGSLLTDVSSGSIAYSGGSVVRADTQKVLGIPAPLLPGNTPGNYGVALNLPLGTPITLPTIPISGINVVSKITGFTTNVALRDIDLDFSSGVLSHTPGFPSTFNAGDVDVSFAAGKADISANVVLDIAGTTGGTLTRAILIPILQGLLPGISVAPGKAFGTDILIGFNFSQNLSLLGDLPNSPTTDGVLNEVGSNYQLTTPVNIDVAAGIDPTLAAILGLDLDLKLSGNIVATAPIPIPLLPGDANHDGLVDGADYTIWADHFGLTGQVWENADFTGDGLVDGADYTVWADHYAPGTLASLAVVPEPSSLALAACGAIGVAIVGRRRACRR